MIGKDRILHGFNSFFFDKLTILVFWVLFNNNKKKLVLNCNDFLLYFRKRYLDPYVVQSR